MKYLLLCLFLTISAFIQPIGNGFAKKESLCINVVYHCIYWTKYDIAIKAIAIDNIGMIHQNLNEAFEDRIYFDPAPIVMYHKDLLTLPMLYNDLVFNGGSYYRQLVEHYTIPGYYNVFILPNSICEESGLLGFTPLNLITPTDIQDASPLFDNAFVSYEGLMEYDNGSTLIHETGHFFGLEHTFELDSLEKNNMGLRSVFDVCVNYMSYGCFLSQFTPEQLDYMVEFFKNNRKYLLKE